MEDFLRLVLPKVLGGTSFEVYPHQGKDELLQRLPDRFRGYASWLPSTYRIAVVVDRDDDDCTALKRRLDRMAREAGLSTRPRTAAQPWAVVSRVAIEELEAWYFGDWEAVRSAYPRVDAKIPRKEKFRDPDAITGGTWEAFERIVQNAGYHTGGLAKKTAAREIGTHIDPVRNRSRSFQALRGALAAL